ncbi:ABC transporter substrate-binding protein [Butyrivibrio sp. AE3004]|uniref:ABC transporter substrate-binding protein n=1 Tax=Butyrivibrio sp. AE3004 TaxID=1506994 RepID=UPI000493C6ED|nr:extracellular solute-binding protein [Butyrivibrio sp. AE3004]
MRKGRLVKGLAIGMVCSMAFLCACGKKSNVITEGVDRPATEIDKDHVYSFEDLDFSMAEDCHIQTVCTSKDNLYVQGYQYNEAESSFVFFKMPFATGEFEEIKLPENNEENVSFDTMTCDEDGNIYFLKHSFTQDDQAMDEASVDETADNETSEDASGESDGGSEDGGSEDGGSEDAGVEAESEIAEYEGAEYDGGEFEENVCVVKASDKGEIIWEKPIVDEDANSYIRSMAYVKGKGLLTCTEAGFSLYDGETGAGKNLIKRESGNDDDYYEDYLFRVKSGDVYVCQSDNDDKAKLYKFNPESLTFEEEGIELPEEVYGGYNMYPGKNYDFYVAGTSEINGFNIGDEKITEVVDYTASNMIVDNTAFIGELADGKIVVATDSYSNEESGSSLGCLTKVDPAAVEDKEIITLGTVYMQDAIRKQAVKFNKKSDKYKINIVDYADFSEDDTGDAYTDGVNRLSLDITSGKAPDIIVVDSQMPFESYALKGVVEPLDPYFEADSEINTSDYLENILEATKIKDSMYSVIPSFSISTCVAAKDNLKGKTVTVENYDDICKKCGIDPGLGMGTVTRADARQLYQAIANSFIDYETGNCSFDSEGFVHFLEFVKELPDGDEEIDYEKYETYYRENKSLLMNYWFSSFDDYQALKKGYFGKDIIFNGYPTSTDGKSYINPTVQVAMSSSCKNKQAVWEFMKSFMSDEYQKKIEWGFPVEKSALEALAEKAQEKPYYLDSKGNKVETSSVWYAGGVEVPIEELSKEETETVMDFVKSVTAAASNDESIEKIIEEEAEAFYEGQKSAEEVADIIQSRVSLYLSEQM